MENKLGLNIGDGLPVDFLDNVSIIKYVLKFC